MTFCEVKQTMEFISWNQGAVAVYSSDQCGCESSKKGTAFFKWLQNVDSQAVMAASSHKKNRYYLAAMIANLKKMLRVAGSLTNNLQVRDTPIGVKMCMIFFLSKVIYCTIFAWNV